MKIVEQDSDVLYSVYFENIKVFDKFATVANNRIVIWRKLTDKINHLVGENPDCVYTPPQPNAVTDNGFPATFSYNCLVFKVESTFSYNCLVFKVESTEYNDSIKIHQLTPQIKVVD